MEGNIKLLLCTNCNGKGVTSYGAKCPNCLGSGVYATDGSTEYIINIDKNSKPTIVGIKKAGNITEETSDQPKPQEKKQPQKKSNFGSMFLIIFIVLILSFYLILHFTIIKNTTVLFLVSTICAGLIILIFLANSRLIARVNYMILQKFVKKENDYLTEVEKRNSSNLVDKKGVL